MTVDEGFDPQFVVVDVPVADPSSRGVSGANVDPFGAFPCSEMDEIWWSDVSP